ncbi:hypothetical protein Bbelb_260300 [Branchiostoma belcheri]|nr:hypothetical protein Bbelb_260300 [Branchiostoma belcheri]
MSNEVLLSVTRQRGKPWQPAVTVVGRGLTCERSSHAFKSIDHLLVKAQCTGVRVRKRKCPALFRYNGVHKPARKWSISQCVTARGCDVRIPRALAGNRIVKYPRTSSMTHGKANMALD